MGNTTRTVKVKFDGDAKGLDRASKDGERSLDRFGKNAEKSFGKSGEKASRSFGSSLKKWFSGEGGGLFTEIGKSGGTVFGSGLLGAIKTPILGPALLAAFAGVTATVMPAVGAIAGGALVTGFGAGIAGLGLVFAAKSEAVKSAWSGVLEDMKAELTGLSKPFEKTLIDLSGTARATFDSFAPALGEAFQKMAEPLSEFGRQIARALEQFKPAIAPVTDAFNAVIKSLGPALVDMTGNISQGFSDLAASVQKNPDALADTARGIGDLTRDALDLITTLNDVNGKFRDMTGVSAVTAVFEGLRGALQLLLGPFAALGGLISGGSNLFASLKGTSDQAGASMLAAAGDTVALAQANGTAAPKIATATAALDAQKQKANDAKQAFEDLIAKTFQYQNLALGLSGSQISFQASIDNATASVQENGRTLDLNTEKGRANRTALNEVASSANAQNEAMLRSGRGYAAAGAASEGARANFVKVATQMGLSKGEAQKLAAQLIAIPNVQREAKLVADKKDLDSKIADAKRKLDDPKLTQTKRAKLEAEIAGLLAKKREAQAAIDSLKGKTVSINVNTYQRMIPVAPRLDKGVRAPGKASGGPVQPRRTYLVGERGPEYLTMGSSPGRVTAAEAGVSAAGGGDTIVYVTIDGEQLQGRIDKTVRTRDRELKRTVKAGG